MRRISSLLAGLIVGCMAVSASGQTGATISYTTQQISASAYQYSFTLTNTGTGPIGTFWFGWYAPIYPGYPAYDLLPSNATSVTSPDGWAGASVQDGNGGYAIEWYETAAPLGAGNSISGFTITTPDAPPTIAGPSILGSFYPVSTSWIYAGALQSGGNPSDQGASVNAISAPEPATIFLISATILLWRPPRISHCNPCRFGSKRGV